jgi:adenosine deaminase
LFQETFAYARSQGLRTVAHAGEAAGAQSVRAAVEVLGAERIGHGVRAVEDPRVLEMLAVRRIAVEVCPTSNFLTGVVARDRPHPLRELRGAGIPIAIDADDPALFGTSIDAEYRYVAEMAGSAALLDTIGNAIEASFASDALKDEMRATLKQASSVVE